MALTDYYSLRILTLLVSLTAAARSLAAEPNTAAGESQTAPTSLAQDRLFHKPGLIYFWALNDACEDAKIDRFVDAFVKGQAAAVCLHPRPGLLKPYGGQAWFDFVKRTVDRCAERGLDVWLYDEDPYPSGACGGLITMERPECQAMEIKRFEPVVAPERNGLYCFPPGTLLWCGLVDEKTGRTEELTPQVGVVRRKWTKLDPWDRRYYYPATPLYSCPRAWTEAPEYAVELKQVPEGWKLLAFVAQPVASDAWPFEPDRLNPDVTRMFIQRTHDRYAAVLGDRVGKQVRAIFTDEAKYNGAFPWTREMFSDFKRQFGYDLPPQLWRLFAPTSDPQTMLTRLHYRQWCGDRFRRAWLEPVSQWCREHKLALVGHISPEDDPVQQTQCVSNLFPCHTSFDVPGLDLIIPAVGDQRHPLINLGVLSAASAAQLPVLRVARELLESLGGLAGDGYRHVIRADRLRAHAADDLEVDPLAGGNRQQRFVARHDASLAVYPQTRSNPVGRVGIAPLGPDPRARLQAQVEAADNQPFTEVRRVIDVRVPRMLGAAGVRELQAPLPAGRRFIGDADAGVLLLAVGVRMVWRHPRRSVLESFIEHPVLYATMIQDLEKEFGVKRLPSVVGELGIDGEKAQGKILDLRKAQAAIADRTELKGKVCFVRTVVRDQRHTILP